MKFLSNVFLLALLLALNGCSSKKAIVQQEEPAIQNPQTTTEKIIEEDTVSHLPKSEMVPEVVPEKEEKTKLRLHKPPLDVHEFRAAWVATVANIN